MHTAELHVNRVAGLPDEAYWEMVDASIELRRQEAAAAKAYDDGMRAVGNDFTRQLHTIVGAKSLPAYLAAHQKQIDSLREARRKRVLTKESFAEFDKTRRALSEQSRVVIQKLGVDVEQVKRLQRDVKKKLSDLYGATLGKGEDAPTPKPRAKNQTFTPPFNGSSSVASWSKWWGDATDNLPDPSFNFFLSFGTGEIGSSTHCSVSDASDYDKVSLMTRSAMRQWFKMPAQGQVRVSNLLEVINSNYSGSVYDEWGWSTIDLKQSVRYFAQVTSPKVGTRVYYYPIVGWQYEVTDEDAPDWSKHRWDVGSNEGMFSQIVLPGVFKKDTWVLVDVGVQNDNWFVSNDVTVNSHQTTHYWTKEIGLSSTGSP